MNIYKYDEIDEFLKDVFLTRIDKNPNLSLRSLSTKMGITSPSAFNQMIRGQRPIPAKFIPLIAKELKLNDNEVNYFNELYFKSKSQNYSTTKDLLKKMNPLKWRKKITLKTDEVPSPLFFALRTFFKRDVESDLKNLRRHFINLVTDDQLLKAYEAIKSEKDSIKSKERLVTKPDSANIKVQDIHQFYLDLAKKNLPITDVKRREYNTYSMNIKEEEIVEIKERIRFFFDSIIEQYGDDKEANSTFQIGGYFYPLTNEDIP